MLKLNHTLDMLKVFLQLKVRASCVPAHVAAGGSCCAIVTGRATDSSAHSATCQTFRAISIVSVALVCLGVQVEPPSSTTAIPATIEAVEARRVEYKDKQEAAKHAPPPAAAKPAAKEAAESNGKHEEVRPVCARLYASGVESGLLSPQQPGSAVGRWEYPI